MSNAGETILPPDEQPVMVELALEVFYVALQRPEASELAKLQAVTDAIAATDGYDDDGRIRDYVSNFAIRTGLDPDKVQKAITRGQERARVGREHRDQRPPPKPNGVFHQAANGSLREKPNAKGEPLHSWEQPAVAL
jgi:hypothetical protein